MHDAMLWLAECSFAPHLQVSVNAISHFCIVAQNGPTPVLSLLSLSQAGLQSVIPGGLLLMSLTNKVGIDLAICCFICGQVIDLQ